MDQRSQAGVMTIPYGDSEIMRSHRRIFNDAGRCEAIRETGSDPSTPTHDLQAGGRGCPLEFFVDRTIHRFLLITEIISLCVCVRKISGESRKRELTPLEGVQ